MERANFYATNENGYGMYEINYSLDDILKLRNGYYDNNCETKLSFDGLTKERDTVELYKKLKSGIAAQTMKKEYPENAGGLCFYTINCYEPNRFVEYCSKIVLPRFEKWLKHDESIQKFVQNLEISQIEDKSMTEFLAFKENEFRCAIYNGFWLNSIIDYKPENAIIATFKHEFLNGLDIKFKGNLSADTENLAERMRSFDSTYNYFKKKHPNKATNKSSVTKLLPTNTKLRTLIAKPQGRQII